MKIAHILWGLENGGTENMLVDILYYQAQTDNQISLYVINNLINNSILKRIPKNIKLHFYHKKVGSKNPLPILRLNLDLFKEKADIIHLHMPNLKKWIFVKSHYVRTIHSCMCTNEDYNKMDLLIAISDAVKNVTIKQIDSSNVITITNGIRIDLIKQKKNFRHSGESLNIIQVSRLFHEIKGQDLVLQSLLKIKNKYPDAKIHYTMVGGGPSFEYLNGLVMKYELSSWVTFLGDQTREYVYSHLKSYDLYLQASRDEGFGLTIAEGMAAKLPVLISELEGPMEVIGYGKYGLTFKTNDAENLAEMIWKIYNSDIDTRIIDSAFNFVNLHYDVKITSEMYCKVYKKILDSVC